MSMGDLLGRRDNRRLKRALMDGSFQAYGYGHDVAGGKVSFVPVSLRYCCTAAPVDAAEDFFGQILYKEAGWVPDDDGHVYVTGRSVDGMAYGNPSCWLALAPGRDAVPLDLPSLRLWDNRVSHNLSGPGIRFWCLRDFSGRELAGEYGARFALGDFRPGRYRQVSLVMDASDAADDVAYFATYRAACCLGATFVTTPGKAEEVREIVSGKFSFFFGKNLDELLFDWLDAVREVSDTIIGVEIAGYGRRLADTGGFYGEFEFEHKNCASDFVWYEMVRPVPSGEFDGVESLRSRGLWPPVTGREVPRLFSV